MALDDPMFRPVVRRTLKAIVVVLWTPIALGLVFLVTAIYPCEPVILDATITDRGARKELIQCIGWNARQLAARYHHGDLAAGIDQYLHTLDLVASGAASRNRVEDHGRIQLEFADADSIAFMLNPASTWIVREHVPDALAPPLAVFADGHVAPLEY